MHVWCVDENGATHNTSFTHIYTIRISINNYICFSFFPLILIFLFFNSFQHLFGTHFAYMEINLPLTRGRAFAKLVFFLYLPLLRKNLRRLRFI